MNGGENRPGLFVSVEGGEGSGKTLLITRLKLLLEKLQIATVITKEPGGTIIGDQIRSVLLDMANYRMDPRAEVLLFQASRAQLVSEVIRPALAKGMLVISDRFSDSTKAYQGYGRGLDVPTLINLISFATGDLTPDVTYLLDVDPVTGIKRRSFGGGLNRLDAENIAFHKQVRVAFRELAAAEKERWVVVDANKSSRSVEYRVWWDLKSRLRAIGMLGLKTVAN